MEIEYDYRRDHFLLINLIYNENSPTIKAALFRANLIILIMINVVFIPQAIWSPAYAHQAIFAAVIGNVFMLLWAPKIQKKARMKFFNRIADEKMNEGLFSMRKVSIEDEGLKCEYPGGSSLTKWSCIVDVINHEKMLILYGKPAQIIGLPKDSIPSDFIAKVLEKVHANKLQPK